MKYLYKVLSKVDREITLPATLTGDAMRPLLDEIPNPVPIPKEKPERRRIQFSPNAFSWRTSATYVAALVLIVALASFLGRSSPEDMVEGYIEPMPSASTTEPEGSGGPPDGGDEQGGALPVDGSDAEPHTQSGTDPAGQDAAPDTTGTQDDGAMGVGGQSEGILLGEFGEYNLIWRTNDATDPDKADIPVTVNIVHRSSGVLAGELNLRGMSNVERHFVSDQALVLIGQSGGATALQLHDLSSVTSPALLFERSQQGRFVDASLHKDIVNLVTFAGAGTDPACETLTLPDSTSNDLCIISSVHVGTLVSEMKAFVGADGQDISLYNLNAYLGYDVEPDASGAQSREVAHVRLDGTEILLRES